VAPVNLGALEELQDIEGDRRHCQIVDRIERMLVGLARLRRFL
jgi:hypothetical protein